MTAPVKAVAVDDIDSADGMLRGAFEICESSDKETSGMAFRCPCGCGNEGYLPFQPEPSPSWHWDGNRVAPTLTPSVLWTAGCPIRWHGWLRNGEWITC